MNINKIILTGILISVPFLLTACTLAPKEPKASETKTENNSEKKTEQEGTNEQQGTLKSMITKDASLKCTFTTEVENSKTTGTVYTNKGKMLMESEVNSSGVIIKSNMLIDSNVGYIWSNENKNLALKLDLTKAQEQDSDDKGAGSEYLKLIENQSTFKCENWNADESKFKLPEGVNFVDFNEMLNKLPVDLCSTCDRLPNGNLKDQCISNYCKEN